MIKLVYFIDIHLPERMLEEELDDELKELLLELDIDILEEDELLLVVILVLSRFAVSALPPKPLMRSPMPIPPIIAAKGPNGLAFSASFFFLSAASFSALGSLGKG